MITNIYNIKGLLISDSTGSARREYAMDVFRSTAAISTSANLDRSIRYNPYGAITSDSDPSDVFWSLYLAGQGAITVLSDSEFGYIDAGDSWSTDNGSSVVKGFTGYKDESPLGGMGGALDCTLPDGQAVKYLTVYPPLCGSCGEWGVWKVAFGLRLLPDVSGFIIQEIEDDDDDVDICCGDFGPCPPYSHYWEMWWWNGTDVGYGRPPDFDRKRFDYDDGWNRTGCGFARGSHTMRGYLKFVQLNWECAKPWKVGDGYTGRKELIGTEAEPTGWNRRNTTQRTATANFTCCNDMPLPCGGCLPEGREGITSLSYGPNGGSC